MHVLFLPALSLPATSLAATLTRSQATIPSKPAHNSNRCGRIPDGTPTRRALAIAGRGGHVLFQSLPQPWPSQFPGSLIAAKLNMAVRVCEDGEGRERRVREKLKCNEAEKRAPRISLCVFLCRASEGMSRVALTFVFSSRLYDCTLDDSFAGLEGPLIIAPSSTLLSISIFSSLLQNHE